VHGGNGKLFVKLNHLENPVLANSYKQYLQKIHAYHGKAGFYKKNTLASPDNFLIMSILVGFIDGDGEAAIQIGARHNNSISKNNIGARIKVSQKNRDTLNAIVDLYCILNPEIFEHVSIYKTTSGGNELSLTEQQSAYFIQLVHPKTFQNPWTSLGAELLVITALNNTTILVP
jgi:hypothetical protein